MDAWKDFDFAKTAIKPAQIQPLYLEDLKFSVALSLVDMAESSKTPRSRHTSKPSRGSNPTLTSTTQCSITLSVEVLI